MGRSPGGSAATAYSSVWARSKAWRVANTMTSGCERVTENVNLRVGVLEFTEQGVVGNRPGSKDHAVEWSE